MPNSKIASRVKVENPPEWHAIYGIKEVLDSDEMEIWIERAHIDHLITVHPKNHQVIPLFIFEYIISHTQKQVTSY